MEEDKESSSQALPLLILDTFDNIDNYIISWIRLPENDPQILNRCRHSGKQNKVSDVSVKSSVAVLSQFTSLTVRHTRKETYKTSQ